MSHRRRKLSDRVQTVIDEVLHALRTDGIDASGAPLARTVQLSRLEERVLMSASPVMVVAEVAGVTGESANSASENSVTGRNLEINEGSSTNEKYDFESSIADDLVETTAVTSGEFEELLEGPNFTGILTNNEPSTTPIDDLLDQLQLYSTLLEDSVSPDDDLTTQISASIEDSLLLGGSSNTSESSNLAPESAMDLIEQVLGDNATTERSTLLSGPEVVVIDYRVQDADVLLAELLADNRDVRLLRLTADEDGLLQISEKLQSLGTVSAIHLLTHGRDGEILLGATRLNAESLHSHAGTLSSWSEHLTNDADVLIYGCDVAATVAGQSFVESLHALTNADIAASNDTTGGSSLGGDWDLEYITGNVATAPLFSPRILESWQHQLPAGLTITVTTTADVVDAADLSSVSALLANSGADGQISLREALIAANANADIDEIVLGAGTYEISISKKDNSAQGGDFDVLESVIIRGAGSGVTRIDANSIDRIFDVRGTSILDVSDVTITGGYAEKDARSGGAVRIGRNASAVMTRVVVSGNAARDDGGGIANDGTLTLVDVSITNNTAVRDGGGLYNTGTATVDRVTFSGNTAANGGAIDQRGAGTSILVTNSTVSGNSAASTGGGVSLEGSATLRNVTIAFNTAGTSAAGLRIVSGTTSVQNTLFGTNLLTSGTSNNIGGSLTSLGNNLSSDTSTGLSQPSDLTNTDPQLEALANNGGATQTHALRQSSAAIDAGTAVGASASDQRSVNRDGAVDIGAYEYGRAFLATSEFQVNTTVSNKQITSAELRGSQQAIARDAFGNYVIVWSSESQDGSGFGVYARRFDAMGNPLSGEFRINQQTNGDQQWARVAMDAAGNFVVTWSDSDSHDGNGYGVFARRFSANGTALGNEFVVNTTTVNDQKNSTIAMNASGDFIIAWEGSGTGDTDGVFFRRYASDGTALDVTEIRANSSDFGIEVNPVVAMDNSGRFVIAWEDDNHIYFQRFDSTGAAQGGRSLVDHAFASSIRPAIAMDAAGNFTIVYREDDTLTGIWGRGYNADGTQRYSWFNSSLGNGASPSITMTSSGEYIVTWQQTGDGDGLSIYARRYNASGDHLGNPFLVNQFITGDQSQSSLIMLDSDNFVVVWSGQGAGDSEGIFARQFGTATARTLTAQSDFVTTPTNTSASVNVLNNDSRPWSGNAIVLDVTSPSNGTAVLDTNGNVVYSPNTGYAGSDSFNYILSDGADGTTNYWGLGGNAIDSVGTNDGTILNGPSVVEGSTGQALNFDEVNDNVNLGDVSYNNEFTLSFDFKVDENVGTVYQYLYSHGDETAVNSLNIILGENNRPGFANVMKTIFGDANDTYDLNALNFDAEYLVGDGQWHTYTLTVSSAGGARVYIDGVLKASDTTRGGAAFNPTGSALLGAQRNLDATRFFGGAMDSVRLFNRSLTPLEVSRLDTGQSPSADSVQTTGTVHVTVQNAPPTAVANGPYSTYVGLPVTLTAAGSSDLNGDALSYEWDLNYDGVTFDADLSGATATAAWNQLSAAGLSPGTHDVAVRVTDSRGAETIAVATLTIQANTAPSDIALSSVLLPGQTPGAIVGALTATDSTPGDSFTYSVDDSRFEVVSGQLKLTSSASIDRAVSPNVPLVVTVTDLAGNTFQKSFVLTVTNGPVTARDNSITVTENASVSIGGNGVLANDDRVATTVTPGAVLDFNAATDTDGDNLWEDSTGVAGLDYQIGSGVTRNNTPATNHPGILSSWVLDGTNHEALVSSDSLATAPGNLTDGNVSFEIWFRPDTVGPQYILFDSGSAQPGTGTSVRLNGSQLEFALYRNGVGAAVVSNISSQLAEGDFIQFVGTIRLSGGVATLEMFVNGVSVGTDSDSTFTIWSDTAEGSALGGIDGTVNVATVNGGVPFAGELAIFRVYDSALSSTQALNNFQAVAGTSSGLTVTSTNTASTAGTAFVNSNGSYSYNPNGQFESLAAGETATDSFTYTTTDGSGNTDTATVQVTITGVNDAPVLTSTAVNLGAMVANESSPVITVASLTTTTTDVDHNATRGIAITATTGTGTWEYSLDGITWTSIGTVSASQALLLDSTSQLRFNGSGLSAGSATVTFLAWDQTGTSAGLGNTKFNTTTTGTGGTTPFSAAAATATLTLDAFNFPPTGVSDNYATSEDTALITTSAAGWFNSAWNTRHRIILNNASGAALTNQVVLITLDGSTIDYAKTQNAGQDLRFVDSDGTLLDYEIEEWNESGISRVWVRVPQIDAGSNTDHLWLYYGNVDAANAQDSAAVWQGQELVLHMDGTVADSSANSLGVVSNSTTATSGISSGAQLFNGVNGSVKVDNSPQVNDLFVGGGTISAWINPAGWGENGYGRIADKASSTFAGGLLGNGWALQVASDGSLIFEQGYTVTVGEWKTSPGTISLNQWQHVTMTFDSSNSGTPPRFFINGVQVATTTDQSPVGLLLLDSAEQLTIGNHAVSDIRTFNGRIDEFRATSTAPSAAQILADYRSMTGTLTSIGAAEAGPGGVLTNDSDPEQQPLTAILVSGPSHASSFSLNPDGSFTYVPVANYYGSDSFTYSVSDGEKSDGPVTVSIVVTPVNDAPDGISLSNTSFASDSPGAVVGTLSISDVDTGDTHTLSVSDARFEIVGSMLRLRADQSINGFTEPNVTLTITAVDNQGASRNQAVTLNVVTVNLAPLAAIGGPYTITEGDSLTVSAAGSTDPENQSMTFAWDLDGDGVYDDATGQTATLTWTELQALSTPVHDDGTRTISVIVTDAGGLSATASTTLTVTNAAPVVTVTGPSTATSGVPITLNLSKSDPGNDTITIWRINWGDGQIEDFAGTLNSASHTYQTPGGTRTIQVDAIDEDGTFSMSGGPLVVTVANTAPSNLAISSTTLDGSTPAAVVGTLTFTDPDFGDVHNIVVSDARFVVVAGVLRLADGQSINPAVESTVNLSITVTDSAGSSTSATFSLNVNTLPIAMADSYNVDGTRRFSVESPSIGVLSNDVDPDGPLRQAVLVNGPSHSQSFGLNDDGTFWYRTNSGYSGTDSFSYRLFDGRVYSAPVVVTLTVNQPAQLDFDRVVLNVDENTTLTTALRIGQFIINDDGIGVNTLTLAGASAVHFELDAQNNLYLKQGSVFDYEATQNLTVIGRVDDPGIAGSPDDTFAVVVSVRDKNDTPVATSLGTTRLAEDFGNASIDVSSAFSDQDGDVLNYQMTVVSQTSRLFSSRQFDSATGVLSLSSNANKFGVAVIDVTATDPSGAVAVSRLRIQVDAVNDAPEVLDFKADTLAGQPMRGTSLLAGAMDVENDPISVVIITPPANGTLTVNADGTFLYTPNTGFFGTETFEFAATDGATVGTAKLATILVQPPVINGGSSSSPGSSSSGTSTGSGGSSTASTNSANTDTPTNNSSTNTNTNTNSVAGDPNNTNLVPEPVTATTPGELQKNLEVAEDSTDDDHLGFIRQFLSTTGIETPTGGRSANLLANSDYDSARRSSDSSQLTFVTETPFGLMSANSPYSSSQQREMLYQTLIAQHIQSVNELENEIGRTFSMSDRVVGSVEVVTTVSSVGYLIWNAVRGGMLLSSLMAQIPAWNMLDPLLVIDGDSKDEDKESLQNIMDQQQKKLKRENAGKDVPA